MIEVLKQALEALEKVKRRAVVMGSTGDYREGQLDALKAVSEDVKPAITPLRQAIAELEREKEIHDRHCNQGEWKGVCKYSDSNCPTIAELESQEPVACGTYQEVTDTMNALWAGTLEQVQIAEEMKNKKLYTAPPQRTWQELTDEEVKHEWEVWRANVPRYAGFAKGIETKLKEKNT